MLEYQKNLFCGGRRVQLGRKANNESIEDQEKYKEKKIKLLYVFL